MINALFPSCNCIGIVSFVDTGVFHSETFSIFILKLIIFCNAKQPGEDFGDR